MMQEQNESNHDIDNISFDTIYPDVNTRKSKNDTTKLLQKDSYSRCCDHLCIWWFFHSSPGLNTYEGEPNDNRCKCICGNCCIWCCEFKCKSKCCLKEIGCCCFTILFE